MTFSLESGQATPINRDKVRFLKNNYNHMKSSLTKTSQTGMIIVARFHPDKGKVLTAKNQIINR
jgi:hypothetical protein